jgi:thiamine biosynthesis lipoprotein
LKSSILFFCLSLFISCKYGGEKKTYVGEAQGTTYQISIYTDQNKDLSEDIDSILKDIDQSLSLYIDESTISKVNDTNTVIPVGEYFLQVFNTSKHIYETTNGAFDPTILPLVKSSICCLINMLGCIENLQKVLSYWYNSICIIYF